LSTAPGVRPYWHAIAAAATILFAPLLLPLVTARVFTLDDLGAFHLPFRYLYRTALRSGDSILWSPALFSGFYAFGEGQVGAAHPFHWLLYRFLPLGTAFNLEILVNYVVLCAGGRLLLSRLGVSREASWVGAAVFAFGGSALRHFVHVNAIAVLAHAPWLFLTTHDLLTSFSRRRRTVAFVGTASLLASQLLLGHPQYVWLTSLAVAFLTACLLAGGARPSGLLLLAAAAGLGVLMGGIQLLPTLDALRGSVHEAPLPAFQLSFSLAPRHLLLLWSPNIFRVDHPQEFGIYAGAFGPLALAWVAVRWRTLAHRRFVGALVVLAVIGLLLALGPSGGLYPWLTHLPGLNSFRAPARHLVLFHLALSGIAAAAFHDLAGLIRRGETLPQRQLPMLFIPALLSTMTTVNAGLRADGPGNPVGWLPLFVTSSLWDNLACAWPWSCVSIALTLLLVLAARGRHWAVPIGIVLAALDLSVWGYGFVYGLRGEWVRTIDSLAASGAAPGEARPGDVLYQPVLDTVNLNVFRALRQSTGYAALAPKPLLDPADSTAQRLAGVAWRLESDAWVRVPDPMPRVRLVSRAERSTNAASDIGAIDISRVALVETDVGPLSGAPGWARVIVDRPGWIEVETIATGTQLLLVTERFHDGWQALVDGRDARVERVFGTYLACVVESGTHRVTFRFQPASVRNGLVASGVGVSLTLVAALLMWTRV
jgi:hypothetical protein